MIWITGDTHRDFSRFDSFCRYNGITKDDLMIVLGDAALNFSGEKSGSSGFLLFNSFTR